MVLTTDVKEYIAKELGIGDCFVFSGLTWRQYAVDGTFVDESGGTGKIASRIVSAITDRVELKTPRSKTFRASDLPGVTLIDIRDIILKNDGHPSGENQYCAKVEEVTPTEGYLTVRTSPSLAAVTVEGVQCGRTPVTKCTLSLGSKTVTIAKSGYNTETRRVTITDGATTDLGTITLTETVTAPECTMTIETDKKNYSVGGSITISGRHTYNGDTPYVGQGIGLSAYLNGALAGLWDPRTGKPMEVTKPRTDSRGRYSFVFKPDKPGTWEFFAWNDCESSRVSVTVTGEALPPDVAKFGLSEVVENHLPEWITGYACAACSGSYIYKCPARYKRTECVRQSNGTHGCCRTCMVVFVKCEQEEVTTTTICSWIDETGVHKLTKNHAVYVFYVSAGAVSAADGKYAKLSPKPSRIDSSLASKDNAIGIFYYSQGAMAAGNGKTRCSYS